MFLVGKSPRVYISIFLAICIVGLFSVAGFYIHRFTTQKNTVNEGRLVTEIPRTEPFLARGTDSTVEEMDQFLTEFDQALADPTILPAERKRLLIQKAQTLTTQRSFAISRDSYAEAATILRSLYESEPKTPGEVVTKNATIPAFLGALRASCYLGQLGKYLPGEYGGLYEKYLAEGHSLNGAVILAYRDFAYNGLDPKFSNDRAAVTSRAFISSVYLYSFGGEPNSTLEREILKGIQEDVAQYPFLEKKLYVSQIKGELEPAQSYAFAFDIAHTHLAADVGRDLNKQIDQNYEDLYPKLDAIIGNDLNSQHMIRALHTMFYLESLHRRYTEDERDHERVSQLVEGFMRDVSYSKETRNVFSGYFLEGKSSDGDWMKVRYNFFDVARKYPNLQAFMQESMGIDP